MTKYNQLFKQQVVNFYFEHHENLAFMENRLLALMNLKRLSMIMSGTIMKNESQLKLKGLSPIRYRKQSFK